MGDNEAAPYRYKGCHKQQAEPVWPFPVLTLDSHVLPVCSLLGFHMVSLQTARHVGKRKAWIAHRMTGQLKPSDILH